VVGEAGLPRAGRPLRFATILVTGVLATAAGAGITMWGLTKYFASSEHGGRAVREVHRAAQGADADAGVAGADASPEGGQRGVGRAGGEDATPAASR